MSVKEIPFGKINEKKIYLNAWGENPERVIGEVRDNEESSVQYFVDRFSELNDKIDTLEREISSSENKGSFLMKLVHLKTQLPLHDGLGDYPALLARLNAQEALLEEIIEKNRIRNTEIKESLLEEVQIAADKINWKEATVEIHDIKARWIKTGNPAEDRHEELEEQFWGVIEAFFEKKKEFYEDKKLLGEKRKRDYEELIEQARGLEGLFGKLRFEKVTALKEAWQEIGNIPKEEYDPLHRKFNGLLKPKRPSKPRVNTVDINSINSTLSRYLGGESYNFKKLEGLKSQLKNYRPQDFEGKNMRREAFRTIQLLMEKDFIDKIANKRFKNFRELEKIKKKQIRIGILEELINRDKTDLEKYQENSANFSSSANDTIGFVEKKLSQQQSKIEIKEALLAILKAEK